MVREAFWNFAANLTFWTGYFFLKYFTFSFLFCFFFVYYCFFVFFLLSPNLQLILQLTKENYHYQTTYSLYSSLSSNGLLIARLIRQFSIVKVFSPTHQHPMWYMFDSLTYFRFSIVFSLSSYANLSSLRIYSSSTLNFVAEKCFSRPSHLSLWHGAASQTMTQNLPALFSSFLDSLLHTFMNWKVKQEIILLTDSSSSFLFSSHDTEWCSNTRNEEKLTQKIYAVSTRFPFQLSNFKWRTSLGIVSKNFYMTETRTPTIVYFIEPLSFDLLCRSVQRSYKFSRGLVARIWRFHCHCPGSIPAWERVFSSPCFAPQDYYAFFHINVATR